MKVLRIVFCILACLCVLACIPAGIWLDWTWALVFALAAVCFAAGMFYFKNKSESKPVRRDFMDGDGTNDKDEDNNK